MERNNKEFVIERSFDGENFEALGTVAGFGTTNNTSNYHYNVLNASEAGMFFRLKQIDFDGEIAYSKVIVVSSLAQAEENNALNDAEFSIFPNPVSSNEIFLEFNNSDKQTVVVKIHDASEKVHYTEEIDIEGTGVTKLFLVPSQTLSRGVYYVTIQTLTKIKALKLVVE
jgi:methionine-rich copper-binding protein CopC